MRISTAHQYETYSRDIAAAQERYVEAQRQVTTGKRLTAPSDDPLVASKLLSLGSLKTAIAQYRKNLDTAKGFLGFTEGALGEASTLLKRAYQIAVRGANDTYDQQAREAMVREIEEIQKRLVDLGNTQGPSGRYIFSGRSTNVKPFSVASTGISFNGDSGDILVEGGPGQSLAANVHVGQLFTDAYNALEGLKNNLTSGNAGAIGGVDIAALQASDNAINLLRGTVGTRLQTVASLQSDHARRLDELTAQASEIEDVDFSEAVMKLRLAETAYQAALGVTSQGFRLSLMDFIVR